MARINYAITDDYFEIIRDKIAEILLDELPNQATLLNNPDLNFTQIWKERTTNFNLNELPALNLSTSEVGYNDKFPGERYTTPVYFIDIYVSKIHEQNNNADQLSMDAGWRIARVIQGVLDHDEYKDLTIAPFVRHAEVRVTRAGEADSDGGGKVSIIRVEYMVDTYSSQGALDPEQILGSDTTVRLNDTEKGYFYQINN